MQEVSKQKVKKELIIRDCPQCLGNGTLPETAFVKVCHVCNGSGRLSYIRETLESGGVIDKLEKE